MEKRYLYFAYGSNMDSARMLERCPGARLVGVATLDGYRLGEHLYADIEAAVGCSVEGLLWSVTGDDLRALDRFEGVATGAYKRGVYAFSTPRGDGCAYAYEMTPQTRRERAGKAFPAWYRDICRRSALAHGVGGFFGNVNKGA